MYFSVHLKAPIISIVYQCRNIYAFRIDLFSSIAAAACVGSNLQMSFAVMFSIEGFFLWYPAFGSSKSKEENSVP